MSSFPVILKKTGSPTYVEPFNTDVEIVKTDPSGDAWLVELHSKIWGHGDDLKSKLFHNVDVTIAHFHALQDRISQLHPDRDSPDYFSKDVLSTKLEFLRSYQPECPLPAHSNNKLKDENLKDSDNKDSEDSDDDEDIDIDNLDIISSCEFPATLKFLDLSSLSLRNTLPLPSPLFIREEYNHISRLIGKLPKNVMVGGQPGTGKTAFLYLKIIEYMLAGHQFLYQSAHGIVYHVSQTVTKIGSWSSSESIVAFVDADTGDGMPKPFLYINSAVKIIAVSSPGGAEQSWLNKATNFVTKLATALWSCSELFLTGIFLHPDDLTFMRLMDSVIYFGYNPRNCFNASMSANNLHQLKAKIAWQISSSPHNVQTLLNETYILKGVSHSIFELISSKDDRCFYDTEIDSVSKWTLDLFLKKYETKQQLKRLSWGSTGISHHHGFFK